MAPSNYLSEEGLGLVATQSLSDGGITLAVFNRNFALGVDALPSVEPAVRGKPSAHTPSADRAIRADLWMSAIAWTTARPFPSTALFQRATHAARLGPGDVADFAAPRPHAASKPAETATTHRACTRWMLRRVSRLIGATTRGSNAVPNLRPSPTQEPERPSLRPPTRRLNPGLKTPPRDDRVLATKPIIRPGRPARRQKPCQKTDTQRRGASRECPFARGALDPGAVARDAEAIPRPEPAVAQLRAALSATRGDLP